jgi:hypothetical protein
MIAAAAAKMLPMSKVRLSASRKTGQLPATIANPVSTTNSVTSEKRGRDIFTFYAGSFLPVESARS